MTSWLNLIKIWKILMKSKINKNTDLNLLMIIEKLKIKLLFNSMIKFN